MKKKIVKHNRINKALTSQDLSAIGNLVGGLIDKQSAVLASKKDLREEIGGIRMEMNKMEKSLKDYMSEGFESVMQGVDAVAEKLADKEKLERLVEWAIAVGEKVGVKPKV